MVDVDLNAVKDLVQKSIDLERLELGCERQTQVCKRQSPDFAPLLLGHSQAFFGQSKENREYKLGESVLSGGTSGENLVPELNDYPHYCLAEQIASPKVMLYEALWEILGWARVPSDTQLSVRPNLHWFPGTCFGLNYKTSEEGTVWFSEHIGIDQALDIDWDNVEKSGEVARVVEHLTFFKENIPEGVNISCPIAAGPLSIADSILGQDIWMLFYDQPEKVKLLISNISDMIIKLLKLFKGILGDPLESSWIGPLHMACGGVKLGDDSIVMMSPEMHKEFVLPSIERICSVFSGGYWHSCGHFPEHLKVINSSEKITVVNLGEPEVWNMPDTVTRIFESGQLYYGGWARLPNESLEEYLRRGVDICGPERNRAILFAMGEKFGIKSGHWPNATQTMDLWHRLQDEIYPV